RSVRIDHQGSLAADQHYAIYARRGMSHPAISTGGDRHRQPLVERAGQYAKIFNVVLLMLREEIVRRDAVHRAEAPPGEPAHERDGIDTDIIQLALRFDQLVPLGRILFLPPRARLGGAGAAFGEERIGVNSPQLAELLVFDEPLGVAGPRLADEAEHVAFDVGLLHGGYDVVRFAKLPAERPVGLPVFSRP